MAEANQEWKLEVTLPSKTPVVGSQINPYVRLRSRSTLHQAVPIHSFSFVWYREMPCSVHFSSLGEDALEVASGEITRIKVGYDRSYEPTEKDFGFILRLECLAVDANDTQLAPVNITVTEAVINFSERCPRSMIQISNEKSSHGLTFSVLSYNLLAELYTTPDKYSYCQKWALLWEYRKQSLLREITDYNADIICLQEVQSNHFESFLRPQLMKLGYSVVYKKKFQQVYSSSSSGPVIDGCAIFYRHNLFKEVTKYELDFRKRARLEMDNLKPEVRNEAADSLVKDNIALIVILEAIRNGSTNDDVPYRLCVANTHILANTAYPNTKLFQVGNLINGLEKIAQSKIPIVICGDFNSSPQSDPHTLLVRGRIDSVSRYDLLGIRKILKLEHSLALVSAYASFFNLKGIEEKHLNRMNPTNREPLFTIFTPRFCGTLDYILYTEDTLEVEGLLELLDSQSLGDGLPSPLWSSDHIALMASFRLKSPSTAASSPPLPQEI